MKTTHPSKQESTKTPDIPSEEVKPAEEEDQLEEQRPSDSVQASHDGPKFSHLFIFSSK